ncbi:hypothetical protein ACFQX7_07855 [Luedemannella flava]
MAGGIGLALLGHLITIVPCLVVLAQTDPSDDTVGTAVLVGLVGQFLLFVTCLVAGIILLVGQRPFRGVGLGLLIGWAVGLLIVPVVGFGLCVQAFSSY